MKPGQLLSASDGTLYKIQPDGSWKIVTPGLKPKEMRRRVKEARARKKEEMFIAAENERLDARTFAPLRERQEA